MVVKELLRGRQPRNYHSNSDKKTPPPFLPDDISPTTRGVTGARLNHGFGIRRRWVCSSGLRVWDSPSLLDNEVWR